MAASREPTHKPSAGPSVSSERGPNDRNGQIVVWDKGTAYDLFACLFVIHNAESVGLRRAWAAGVRNRLNPENREMLGRAVPIVGVPVEWIRAFPEPRDAAAVLSALESLHDEAVLDRLVDARLSTSAVVRRARDHGAFTSEDVDALLSDSTLGMAAPENAQQAQDVLRLFSEPEHSGAVMKAALEEFVLRFFREEELRIGASLDAALAGAKERARSANVVELVEELSGGLRLEDLAHVSGLMLIPSFWAGPLVLFETLPDGTYVILFGARPRDVSLIPGEPVPDALIRALQAVSDPTRLRILKILAAEPRSQIEIARELRLRPPTITHHLKILRMANLVRLTESTAGEKRYDVREVRLQEIVGDLVQFVGLE